MNELSDEERSLLAHATRAPGPSAEQRARVRRALAIVAPATAAGTVVAASNAAATSLGALKTVFVFVAAASVGAGVVAGGVAVKRSVSEPAQLAPPRPAPRPMPLEAPAELPPPPRPAVAPEPPPPEPAPPALAPTPAPRASARAPAAAPVPIATPPVASAPVAPAANPCTLPLELSAVQEAQRLLPTPRASLERLDAFEAECPHGELDEERNATRALALCALGRKAEGRAVLETLTRKHPESPSISHVTHACAGP